MLLKMHLSNGKKLQKKKGKFEGHVRVSHLVKTSAYKSAASAEETEKAEEGGEDQEGFRVRQVEITGQCV